MFIIGNKIFGGSQPVPDPDKPTKEPIRGESRIDKLEKETESLGKLAGAVLWVGIIALAAIVVTLGGVFVDVFLDISRYDSLQQDIKYQNLRMMELDREFTRYQREEFKKNATLECPVLECPKCEMCESAINQTQSSSTNSNVDK